MLIIPFILCLKITLRSCVDITIRLVFDNNTHSSKNVLVIQDTTKRKHQCFCLWTKSSENKKVYKYEKLDSSWFNLKYWHLYKIWLFSSALHSIELSLYAKTKREHQCKVFSFHVQETSCSCLLINKSNHIQT